MLYLLVVSIIWASSFGLIKENLLGIDSCLVSAIRLFFALIVFLPFLRLRGLKKKVFIQLTLLGAIQYGLMYLCYIAAFEFLKAYEVAILTLFTPLFVTLVSDFWEKRIRWNYLMLVIIAVFGSVIVIAPSSKMSSNLMGIGLMQLSNLCFAVGQVYYRKLAFHNRFQDHSVFALLFFGAFLICALPCLFITSWHQLSITTWQFGILLYLGVVASGACFFMWNKGACAVNTAVLAIFNNLKIPCAVFISTVFFGEDVHFVSFIWGSAILIFALIWASKKKV